VVLVFLTGVIVGTAVGYMVAGLPIPEGRLSGGRGFGGRGDRGGDQTSFEEMVERLDKDADLNLDEPQRMQLEKIMQESREKYREIDKKSRAEFSRVRKANRESIRKLLRPDQMEKFDSHMGERFRRRQDRHEPEDSRED
jgi:Spy/CpxP family protein refolding chaperone